MNFKTWSEQKKVKEPDLVFVRCLQKPLHRDLFGRVSDHMATLQPSFSDGLVFLELISELILMGHTEALMENSAEFETWKTAVHRLRYPVTAVRDGELKEKFENLPWPQGSKVKFERRGDRSGVELKLFISSATDLTKIRAALERVQQDLGK